MFQKNLFDVSVLIMLLLFAAACQPKAGLPNPASEYCEENEGKLEIREDESGGQVGYCVFPDGSECEEWAFYRGECQPGDSLEEQAGLPNPASAYCEENEGTLEIREDESGGQLGFCVFPDGSECEEWAFYREECQPGDSLEEQASLPNPASAYCEEKDGTLEIREDETGGQVGYCVFPDGSECEEWAFFRGECQPGDN